MCCVPASVLDKVALKSMVSMACFCYYCIRNKRFGVISFACTTSIVEFSFSMDTCRV